MASAETTPLVEEQMGTLPGVVPTLLTEVGRANLVRNTMLNLGGQVLPMAAGVALMPYIVRGLGPDRFGVLGIGRAKTVRPFFEQLKQVSE